MFLFLDIPKVWGRFKIIERLPGNRKFQELKFCVPTKKYKK